MIRLFKHYVPNTVLLLALLDVILLVTAGELGWQLRAHESNRVILFPSGAR